MGEGIGSDMRVANGTCLSALVSPFLPMTVIDPGCVAIGINMGLLDAIRGTEACGIEADDGIGSNEGTTEPSGEWLPIFLLLILLTTGSQSGHLSPISPKSREEWACSIASP